MGDCEKPESGVVTRQGSQCPRFPAFRTPSPGMPSPHTGLDDSENRGITGSSRAGLALPELVLCNALAVGEHPPSPAARGRERSQTPLSAVFRCPGSLLARVWLQCQAFPPPALKPRGFGTPFGRELVSPFPTAAAHGHPGRCLWHREHL